MIDAFLAVLGALLLLNIGIFIGREFGSFKGFAETVLKKLLSDTQKNQYIASEEIEIGAPVIISSEKYVKNAIAENTPGEVIVGVASRDLMRGELILYSPFENTDDIIITKKP